MRAETGGEAHVAHEGVEGTEHRPARAERLGRVGSKAADVRTDHRHLVDARKAKDASDGLLVVRPLAEVVAEPLADVLASTRERRACDNEWTETGAAREHRVPGRGRHHRTVQVVHVVLDQAVRVDSVRLQSEDRVMSCCSESDQGRDARRQSCQRVHQSGPCCRWRREEPRRPRRCGQHACAGRAPGRRLAHRGPEEGLSGEEGGSA